MLIRQRAVFHSATDRNEGRGILTFPVLFCCFHTKNVQYEQFLAQTFSVLMWSILGHALAKRGEVRYNIDNVCIVGCDAEINEAATGGSKP